MQSSSCFVVREGVKSGPYSALHLAKYVSTGDVLLQDLVEETSVSRKKMTVKDFLALNKVTYELPQQPSLVNQLRVLWTSLVFPSKDDFRNRVFKDERINLMFAVGLTPLVIIMLLSGASDVLTFYLIAVYFSFVWAIFYLILFKTHQVVHKLSVGLFFISQVSTVVITSMQGLPPFSLVYSWTDSGNIVIRALGFIIGVGGLEEFAKALPVFLIALRQREPLVPRTLVYYGLISGLGFGTVEGVIYQMGVNSELDYSSAYFLNVARLTTLPFLHSVWTATAAYFISFRFLLPKYRSGLLVLSIVIPAILHGLYDTLTFTPILSLLVTLFSVVLLVHFLSKSQEFRSNIKSVK